MMHVVIVGALLSVFFSQRVTTTQSLTDFDNVVIEGTVVRPNATVLLLVEAKRSGGSDQQRAAPSRARCRGEGCDVWRLPISMPPPT